MARVTRSHAHEPFRVTRKSHSESPGGAWQVGTLDSSPAELLALALRLAALPARLRYPGGGGVPRLRAGVARGKVAVGPLGTRGHSCHLVGGAAAAAERLQRECRPGEIRVQPGLARRPDAAHFRFEPVPESESPPSPLGAAAAGRGPRAGPSAPAVLLVGKR
jgi:hypothetical protein